MKLTDRISQYCSQLASTAKSLAKIALLSRRHTVTVADRGTEGIIILGNGPSLNDTMRDCADALASHPLMAVNFAANTDECLKLRPQYYILVDPHFFNKGHDVNVDRLYERLSTLVDWPMTMFVPVKSYALATCLVNNRHIKIETFNPVGVEGFAWIENMAFRSGAGMPRPRNVMIPAIMCAMLAGYRRIALAGADHSWMKTIEVNDNNEVVSVQPHFYEDNEAEKSHVVSTYRNYRLHDIVRSFYVAFKSYFAIKRYAEEHGVEIINVTPGSFIDAFERKDLNRF